jgi:2-hydroxychromene-2-carboxylate isomerase
MSLRTLLTPLVSSWLLSPQRQASARARAERRRQARGLAHEVHYFHQVDDPYSALACQALAGLQARYDIRLLPHLVSPPADAAAPDRARLVAYSRRDAAVLAVRHGLAFADPGHQPAAEATEACAKDLLAAIDKGHFTEAAPALAAALWTATVDGPGSLNFPKPGFPAATDARSPAEVSERPKDRDVVKALAEGDALRERLGHYLGGTFFYGGEWYWGIDRLHHLERRLQDLGAARAGVAGTLAFAPDLGPDRAPHLPQDLAPPSVSDLQPALSSAKRAGSTEAPLQLVLDEPVAEGDGNTRQTVSAGSTSNIGGSGSVTQTASAPTIDFFFSLRSPYSAIVMPRVFALARAQGAPVRLRFVLPMVMRGLAVPASKRRYISLDAAREARLHRIPFGRLNDPVGRPTERGLALIPFAHTQGRAEAYLLAFMQGVWSKGLDAGSDKGLRAIVEAAGLPWAEAREALADERWREIAERNRQALLDLGLWGVPSFHVAGASTWGQDRLWQVREALIGESLMGESLMREALVRGGLVPQARSQENQS